MELRDVELDILSLACNSADWLADFVYRGLVPQMFTVREYSVLYELAMRLFLQKNVKPTLEILSCALQLEQTDNQQLKLLQTQLEQASVRFATTRNYDKSTVDGMLFLLQEAFLKADLEALVKRVSHEISSGRKTADILRDLDSYVLSHRADSRPEARPIGDFVAPILARIESGEATVTGAVSTGVRSLDVIVSGFVAGQVYVLGARPAMGKTALALQLASRVASRAPVLFCSLEMTSGELTNRLLSHMASVDSRTMRSGALTQSALNSVRAGAERLSRLQLFIDDSSSQDLSTVRASIERLNNQGVKPALIVIDYLQLMRPADSKVSREQQIATLSRSLKCIAKDCSVPILLLCQLNRSVEQNSRAPRLSDLRESGAIEQDADVVMFIDKPEGVRESDFPSALVSRTLLVSKNRHGEVAGIPLAFAPAIQRFFDFNYERDEAEAYMPPPEEDVSAPSIPDEAPPPVPVQGVLPALA